MHLVILTMRDSKIGIYMQPFAALSIPSATRDLRDIISQAEKQLPWQKFPADFDLYRSGSFDSDTGKLTPEEPTFLYNLSSITG